LIGFKTEGINLPSFIMLPGEGPVSGRPRLSSSRGDRVVFSLGYPLTRNTRRLSSVSSVLASFHELLARRLYGVPVSALAIDPGYPDWGLKYEVYLDGFKTSFALAVAQNSPLDLSDIACRALRAPCIFNFYKCTSILGTKLHYRSPIASCLPLNRVEARAAELDDLESHPFSRESVRRIRLRLGQRIVDRERFVGCIAKKSHEQ